jgi:hypothetical protein
MVLNRRHFLTGLAIAASLPAVARAEALMLPVSEPKVLATVDRWLLETHRAVLGLRAMGAGPVHCLSADDLADQTLGFTVFRQHLGLEYSRYLKVRLKDARLTGNRSSRYLRPMSRRALQRVDGRARLAWFLGQGHHPNMLERLFVDQDQVLTIGAVGDEAWRLLRQGFRGDLHQEVAANLLGVPPQLVSREQRELVKRLGFFAHYAQGGRW